MKKNLRFILMALLCAVTSLAWGEDTQVLFHETFGDNSGSARAWDDSYSVKSGIEAVYAGITGYTVSNVKQGRNTTGYSGSGLNQSTQGTDASIIIGPLNVANYSSLQLFYRWKAGSIKGTFFAKAYYATSSTGEYSELQGSAAGDTQFVPCSYSLPSDAQVSTLYLKIVFNTSNTQAIIDEVELTGVSSSTSSVTAPTFSLDPGIVPVGSKVTISAVDDLSLYYTLDGSDPTTSSTTIDANGQTATVTINSTTTIKAVAMDGEANFSNVVSAEYQIVVAAPTFSPAGGLYAEAQDVTITAADNCTISYTTDGSDPVESGTAVTTDGNTAIVNVNSTTTIKAVAMDTKLNFSEVATATYTIVSAYATLPFEFDGGASDIAGTEGLIQNGLGSDYSNKPYLKFNDTGDYLILRFNERPGTLSFDIRGWDFSGGTFTVQTSEDGTSYTDLETYTALSDTQSEEFNLNLDSYKDVRYIKWIYTNKSIGNVALGNISLLDYVDQTPYTLTITSNENSYIYAFDESDQSEALESPASVIPGTSILLSVDVSDGYKLESLNVVAENGSTVTVTENPEDKSYTFTMPESNVTVSCTVSKIAPVEGFYESFDRAVKSSSGANIIGGNDNPSVNGEDLWSGNAGNVDYNDQFCDMSGWTMEGSPKMGYQCVRLGTSSSKGSATTPALKITGNATLTFKAGAWKGDGTTLQLSIIGDGTLSESSVTMTHEAWNEYTISITGLTTNSKIKFSTASGKNRFFLDEVKVVKATAEPVEITIGSLGYASMYYGTLNLEVPTGVTATTYTLTADNNPAASKTYSEGKVIPAGEGVILQGSAGTYQFNIAATTTETKDANNKLKGSDTEERTTGPAGETSGYLFYVLSTYQGKDPGFYWNTEDGSAFTSAAHKVYLPIPATGSIVAAFSFDGMNGINETMLSVNANEDVYTISGVKVNAQQLQKGLYIINGKKVVIK